MTGRAREFRPFAPRARSTIIAIVASFALILAASAAVSIWSTSKSRNRAAVVEIAGRQRTLAERYVTQLLLVRGGEQASPQRTGVLLTQSVNALLNGGTAPAVEGDDDDVMLERETDPRIRAEIVEQQKLIRDLLANGNAFLARRTGKLPETAGERITTTDQLQRLRVLSALTSNVSLSAAREIAARTDRNVKQTITLQVALGAVGILVSVLLAWALVATTRRQTAHFRSLVSSSTDLVLVLAGDSCRYASTAVERLTGQPQSQLTGKGILRVIHEEDVERFQAAQRSGDVRELVFRMRNAAGEWRHLEAHLTDLRADRHVRGVVLNSRDITERVRLEQELTRQAQRDNFGSQLVEALEMADEEAAAYDVVRRAMVEIGEHTPMELLLSDSSRAHLDQTAVHPLAGAPSCPVESPYSCVAVRRGHAVVFETSEALNACPKLRDREHGPCSAVCVPISFMGRSLGVLHATGPDRVAPSKEQVAQLTTLATQAGARIGTVRAFEKTQLQAQTDGLTGLINRRTLETELRGLLRDNRPFALALADLDHFKRLNDTHGHEEGDRSLRLFSHVLRQVLRDDDLVARWGGEEFLIALPDADAQAAVEVMDRIRAHLARTLDGGQVRFTASFGVSDSTAAASLQELIQLADIGLYLSKAAGRDRTSVGVWTDVREALGAGNGTRRTPAFHRSAAEDEPNAS
ncbi:MAG TPA: diguanylate cyclase [Gaiellaceae bacterium]|jgi:diguanylate cyclase (GGDEF)-like protein/PAS domain S-box-containing protein